MILSQILIIDDGQLVIDSINYGYIPFFIKIEDDNPLYFIAHKNINMPLEDLNIKPLSIIIGSKEKKQYVKIGKIKVDLIFSVYIQLLNFENIYILIIYLFYHYLTYN